MKVWLLAAKDGDVPGQLLYWSGAAGFTKHVAGGIWLSRQEDAQRLAFIQQLGEVCVVEHEVSG